jgi:hypothetical protein
MTARPVPVASPAEVRDSGRIRVGGNWRIAAILPRAPRD